MSRSAREKDGRGVAHRRGGLTPRTAARRRGVDASGAVVIFVRRRRRLDDAPPRVTSTGPGLCSGCGSDCGACRGRRSGFGIGCGCGCRHRPATCAAAGRRPPGCDRHPPSPPLCPLPSLPSHALEIVRLSNTRASDGGAKAGRHAQLSRAREYRHRKNEARAANTYGGRVQPCTGPLPQDVCRVHSYHCLR